MGLNIETLIGLCRQPALLQPLWLSLQVAICTLFLHAITGLCLGYLLSRKHWPGCALLDIAISLPLVFPPMATGFALMMLFSKHGAAGSVLWDNFNIEVIFSFWGLLLASFVSGLPLATKPIQSGFENLPVALTEAARTLGKNDLTILFRILLPNIRSAIATALALSLGRTLGEVGITLMLGGNISGRTVTASLEIYNAVTNGEYEKAGLISLILGIITVLIFALLRKTSRSPIAG